MRILLFLFSFSLHALSIVFVHVGPSPLPDHLPFTIAQAHLFNPKTPIYLLAYREQIQKRTDLPDYLICIPCETLPMTQQHRNFRACRSHDQGGEGFWIWTLERFFFLSSFIKANKMSDVFHLENDIMLYADLEELLPIFQRHYHGMIGATFENDQRCAAGFLYISQSEPLEGLVQMIPPRIDANKNNDMQTLAKFKDSYHRIWIDFLPTVIPEYINEANREIYEKKAKNPPFYYNHIEEFQSVFDAAAIGVYLAGWDPKFHEVSKPGQIDPHCLFDASHFTYEWDYDVQGRRIPFLNYNGKKMRINNLHLTNKTRIPFFSSKSNERHFGN